MITYLETIYAYCLEKRESSASYPFGEGALVIKVLDKMFALILDEADPLVIKLKCDPEDAQALRCLLGARYQIMEDDRRLREAANNAAGDSRRLAASFDTLRKHYRVRRELAGSPVFAAKGSGADLLRALGCTDPGDR